MKAAAVVAAAGEGARFEGRGPRKQFRALEGRPIAERSCRAVRADPGVGFVVLVLPADVAGEPPGWTTEAADRVVAGGDSRRASVARGLDAVPGGTEVVLVHDGVRPLVTADLVGRVRRAARGGAVVPVLPVLDTVKEVSEQGRVVRTLERSRLRRVQTPQGFPAGEIGRAHRRARAEGWAATDDAGLCERAGITVSTVQGEPGNLKITTADDLARAEWILRRRRSGGDG